jgi:hypothetical protein
VGEREGAEWVVREGVGGRGRNDPNTACTYELKKKRREKKMCRCVEQASVLINFE